jgi:hypothetical protein
MNFTRHPVLSLLLATLLLLPGSAAAQLTDASLKGLVRASAGSPVAGSTVTVTLEATGQVRTTQTSAEGTFLLAGLTPGTYALVVEAPGHQPVGQADLRLASGSTVDVTIDLPDVTMAEQVDVTASGVTIAASRDPRLTEHFDRKAVQDLPLPQRDIFLLPSLSAGAALVPACRSSRCPTRCCASMAPTGRT